MTTEISVEMKILNYLCRIFKQFKLQNYFNIALMFGDGTCELVKGFYLKWSVKSIQYYISVYVMFIEWQVEAILWF